MNRDLGCLLDEVASRYSCSRQPILSLDSIVDDSLTSGDIAPAPARDFARTCSVLR
jgi:hypothetical protein